MSSGHVHGDHSKGTSQGSGHTHTHEHGHFAEVGARYGEEEEEDAASGFEYDAEDANGDVDEEIIHFEAVTGAMAFYEIASRLQFQRLTRHFLSIPPEHQKLFDKSSSEESGCIHPLKRIHMLNEAAKTNTAFLERVLAKSANFLYPAQPSAPRDIISRKVQPRVPHKNPLSGFNADKLHSTLCQIAREWSSDGQNERIMTFNPILEALDKYLPVDKENMYSLKVICPGSGLGRLPLEICRRGYQSMGNEFSFFMLIMSNFILNSTQKVEEFVIYPWIHQMVNIRNSSEQLEAVKFPDIAPFDLPENAVFGCAAGDFLEIATEQKDEWDAVVTCFFLDTANNIVSYLEAIFSILKPGSYWINIGPLLYHYSDSAELSLELTLDQVLYAAKSIGFEIIESKTVQTRYAAKKSAMMNILYDAEFWVARKPLEREASNEEK